MKFTMYAEFSNMILNEGIEKAAEYALQLGFSSVEFLANSFDDKKTPILNLESAKRVKDVLDKYKLPTACYSVFSNLWRNPDGEKYLMNHVEIAAALGSPYLHHTLIPWLALPDNAPDLMEAIEEVTEVAVRIADYAAGFGITCIYEDQGFYVNGVNGFNVFWEKMKKHCKNVGICGDLGNILFVNEAPEDFLNAYIKDICHVHVKDYLLKRADRSPGRYWVHAKGNTWLRDTMVGSGVIDFEACMKILKSAGYQGYFSLENMHPEPYEEGVLQAMEYLQRYW